MRILLQERLERLSPEDFQLLLFHLQFPSGIIPANANQRLQSLAVMQHYEQPGRSIEVIWTHLQDVATEVERDAMALGRRLADRINTSNTDHHREYFTRALEIYRNTFPSPIVARIPAHPNRQFILSALPWCLLQYPHSGNTTTLSETFAPLLTPSLGNNQEPEREPVQRSNRNRAQPLHITIALRQECVNEEAIFLQFWALRIREGAQWEFLLPPQQTSLGTLRAFLASHQLNDQLNSALIARGIVWGEHITIDLMVPDSLLCENVAEWHLGSKPIQELVPYSIRSITPYLNAPRHFQRYGALLNTWERLQESDSLQASKIQDIIAGYTGHCLVPPTHETQEVCHLWQGQTTIPLSLLEHSFRRPTPAILFHRTEERIAPEQVSIFNNKQWKNLPLHLYQYRQTSNEAEHFAGRCVLYFDNPTRLPPEYHPFGEQ